MCACVCVCVCICVCLRAKGHSYLKGAVCETNCMLNLINIDLQIVTNIWRVQCVKLIVCLF